MDPQMLAALGLAMKQQQAGGMGAPMGAPMGAQTAGGMGAPPVPSPMPASPTPTPMPSAAPMGGPQALTPPASNPGLMASPAPQQTPGVPNMAGNSPAGGQEATGEQPNKGAMHQSLPHFPRNHLGAMLLPRGGQINNQGGMPQSPFNPQSILAAFLQRQPGSTPPTVSGM